MSAPRLSKDEPLVRSLVEAIHAGQIETVKALMQTHPDLAPARLVDEKGGSGTPLHAVTDWPGFFPNGPEIVAVLIDAGTDPNAPIEGGWHAETPLHWAASSDDVDVARALIDGGANIEAVGASVAGGIRRPSTDNPATHRRVLAGMPRRPTADGRASPRTRRRAERHPLLG